MKEKIISIINSCETTDHLISCDKMIYSYYNDRMFKISPFKWLSNYRYNEAYYEYQDLINILSKKALELNYE